MGLNMNISGYYGTHLVPLMVAMDKTKGDVLELGTGIFSTPYLHYRCTLDKRKLFSYDTSRTWLKFFKTYKYENKYHKFIYIKNWDKAQIERPWDVVLVDHSPDTRRIAEIKRVANLAKFIIVHDSNGRFEKKYHYSMIYPLFKHKTDWVKEERHATILSNFVKLENLLNVI
jgi:hypothetical protein